VRLQGGGCCEARLERQVGFWKWFRILFQGARIAVSRSTRAAHVTPESHTGRILLLTIGVNAAANPPRGGSSGFAHATRLATTTMLTTASLPNRQLERVSTFFRSFYKAGQTRLEFGSSRVPVRPGDWAIFSKPRRFEAVTCKQRR
jgi:hypothetical protein